MGNQQATKISLDWFIGFMEGEGCFIERRSNAHLRLHSSKPALWQPCQVRISNKEKDVLGLCLRFLFENYIHSYILTGNRGISELYINTLFNCKRLYNLVNAKMECRHNELERILGASTTIREVSCNLNWLIGLYEAEACFNIDIRYRKGEKVSYTPSVCIDNTNMRIIDKVILTLKQYNIAHYIVSRTPENINYNFSKSVRIIGYKRVYRFLTLTDGMWCGLKTIRRAGLVKEFCEERLSKDPYARYSDNEHRIARQIKIKI